MKKIALFIFTLLYTCQAFSQTTFGDNVTDAPIDGGLSLLVASGIAYGLSKKRRKK